MDKVLEKIGLGCNMMFKKVCEVIFVKIKGNYLVLSYIIDVIEMGMNEGMKVGFKVEVEVFGKFVMMLEFF